MKQAISWISLSIVLIALYVTDIFHLSTSRYNLFIVILLGLITTLIVIIKICHTQPDQEQEEG